jgi:hypothetical protein
MTKGRPRGHADNTEEAEWLGGTQVQSMAPSMDDANRFSATSMRQVTEY